MTSPDLNLLVALDVLLSEGSVRRAAERLGLSASAMSRTLTRLRQVTGDPLLVRAGRGLVPTPRAEVLRTQARDISRAAQALLSPARENFDPSGLRRVFTIRSNEGFRDAFLIRLAAHFARLSPGLTLIFAPKPDKTSEGLRDGLIDLEIGVIAHDAQGSAYAPELRVQALFRDGFIGVARSGHPLFSRPLTPADYAACQHVVTSRRGLLEGPVDRALADLGLCRMIGVVMPGFGDALNLVRESDFLTLVPRSCLVQPYRDGIRSFELPVETSDITVHALWHPRLHEDSAHRWVRNQVIMLCRQSG